MKKKVQEIEFTFEKIFAISNINYKNTKINPSELFLSLEVSEKYFLP